MTDFIDAAQRCSMKTLQLWPSGQSVTYIGDFPDYLIREKDTERPATHAEAIAIRVEELSRMYSERDILACQSCLMDKLLREEVFTIDDIDGLYPDPSEWSIEECRNFLDEYGEPAEDVDDWRDAVRDNAEPLEIFEWWLITPWLCNELRHIGQPVIDDDYGCWWGRCCTGQSYIMDGTLQEIAKRYVIQE